MAVFLLRGLLGPSSLWTVTTTVLYAGPYLFLTFCPYSKASAQTGLALGYAIGMCTALGALLVGGAVGFPSGPMPSAFWGSGCINLGLIIVAALTWIWNRGSVRSGIVASMIAPGIFYPFAAFLLEVIVMSTFDRT